MGSVEEGDAGVPAGWHPDPNASGHQRWWDGARWSEHRWPQAQATQSFVVQEMEEIPEWVFRPVTGWAWAGGSVALFLLAGLAGAAGLILLSLASLAAWVVAIYFVYKDRKQLGKSPVGWTVFIVVTSWIGFIVYCYARKTELAKAAARPRESACRACGASLAAGARFCRQCGAAQA